MRTMRTFHVDDTEEFAARIAAGPPPPRRQARRRGGASDAAGAVQSILDDVRDNGDAAVLKYERRFAGAAPASLRVSRAEIRGAYSAVSAAEIDAIRLARSRLAKTESAVRSALRDVTVRIDGEATAVRKRFVPIQSVGCYVPGGLARYPSTAVMSVVPAKIAGVPRIAVVSPPAGPDRGPDPLTVVAADICGADEIYKAGGAQAIAALSYGTETIRRVDKIVGPGGAFVTAAKHLASARTAIDMLAGPTELGIVADSSADPRHIALDLISQAEHSGDTTCYLVTTSAALARDVARAVSEIVPGIRRREIVEASLKNNGFIAVCRSAPAMARLADALAPEHLEIMTRDPGRTASRITAPGLVLVGGSTPSAASDYLLGSNHVLPTRGFGRARGSLSVLDFVKTATQVECSGASPLLSRPSSRAARCLKALTDAETLPNHYEAVAGRIRKGGGGSRGSGSSGGGGSKGPRPRPASQTAAGTQGKGGRGRPR